MGHEKYEEAFKKKIVELYRSGNSASSISDKFKISETSIYNWLKQFPDITKTEVSNISLSQVLQENMQLKEENEVLKKAFKIFLTNNKSTT